MWARATAGAPVRQIMWKKGVGDSGSILCSWWWGQGPSSDHLLSHAHLPTWPHGQPGLAGSHGPAVSPPNTSAWTWELWGRLTSKSHRNLFPTGGRAAGGFVSPAFRGSRGGLISGVLISESHKSCGATMSWWGAEALGCPAPPGRGETGRKHPQAPRSRAAP